MEKNDMKKFFIIQYIIIGLLVVLCLFLIFDKENDGNNNQTNESSNKIQSDYDTSSMKEVSVADTLKLFENKGQYLLYIGRSTCGVCKALLPNLLQVQEELNIKTQYLDITKANRSSSDWEKLEKLLDKETIMSITNDKGEQETVSNTYGYFLGNYGYTPTLIIIDHNKMIAGHIGNFTAEDLTEWLQTNGFE